VATKRRLKQSEAAKEKVPHEIRQRYVNMFTEEFLKTTENVNDAFEKVTVLSSMYSSLSDYDPFPSNPGSVDRPSLKRRPCTIAV